MLSKENRKNRIVSCASWSFMISGYSSVTMDDIAQGLHMSKATLYRYFPSKEKLIFASIESFTQTIYLHVETIIGNERMMTIEKLESFLRYISQVLSSLNPASLIDLKRSLPEGFEMIEVQRRAVISNSLVGLLAEGKQSGLFREDINENLVALIVMGASRQIIESKLLSETDFKPGSVFKAVLDVILRGCLNDTKPELVFNESDADS